MDKADIPAPERGILRSIAVELGDDVAKSQVLAILNDVEARLVLEQSQLDLSVAERRFRESVDIPIAEAALLEATNVLNQARLESDIANRMAESDIPVRQAETDLQLSESDLARAIAARNVFSASVSEQQFAKLTQVRDTDQLKLERVRYDQVTDQLRCRSKQAMVEQHQTAAARLQHAVSEARTDRVVAELNIQSLRKAVAIAQDRLDRRTLRSPLSGIVAEKLRHEGEWVEAGEPVLKIISLDQMLVQGFVDARLVKQSSRGRSVRVECDSEGGTVVVEGILIFVSPEIDATNQQVEVRAEIPNPKLVLRPGQPAKMEILPSP